MGDRTQEIRYRLKLKFQYFTNMTEIVCVCVGVCEYGCVCTQYQRGCVTQMHHQ